jgi:capsular polysaccharide biosynthesis protein
VDFWDLTRLMYRRWYFSVPMLLLAVFAMFLAGGSVKPDYQATSHLQILPAAATGDAPGAVRNPWNDMPMSAIGDATIVAVSDQKVLHDLVARGYSDKVTITLDNRSPIVTVLALSRSRQQASGTVREVGRLIEQKLASLQRSQGVPPNRSMTIQSLDAGDNIDVVTSRVKRTLAALIAASLLVTAGVTIGLDALVSYWSRRRSKRRSTQNMSDASGLPGYEETQEIAMALRSTSPRMLSVKSARHSAETDAAEDQGPVAAYHDSAERSGMIPEPRQANGETAMRGTTYRHDDIPDNEATIVLRTAVKRQSPDQDRGSTPQ